MLVIASRGSLLALWQARWVQAQLAAAGHECRIEIIKTTGDKITDVPLAQVGAQVGTKGLFTKEIEEALLDGRADLAVHSRRTCPPNCPRPVLAAVASARMRGCRWLTGLPSGLPTWPRRAGGDQLLRRAAQLRNLAGPGGGIDTRQSGYAAAQIGRGGTTQSRWRRPG
jgi:hydroxymethylbilane synthase